MLLLQKNEIGYDFQCTYVTQPKDYLQDDYCNAIVITNEDKTGQTVAVINGKLLQPPPAAPAVGMGESMAIGGNRDELYRGKMQISFMTLAGGPVLTGRISVVEKVYLRNRKM